MKKILFIIIGILSVILGIIGIFVPGLPTTPFLLLSSWFFYKSSRRLHDWLHLSRLGKYIRRYESGEGISLWSKLFSIACMWTMICISAFLIIENLHLRILLLVLGCIGSVSVLFIVPTAKRNRKCRKASNKYFVRLNEMKDPFQGK